MKTILPDAITCEYAAKYFIDQLYENGELFHLEDDAKDIIASSTGARLFTDEEATKINSLLDQLYEVCEFDPMAYILDMNFFPVG